jgi:glyoxylase-like metal-dependent hydrolase (beta-lactamase superfamily II)
MQQWIVGNVKITKILEREDRHDAAHLFPKSSAAVMLGIPWLAPYIDAVGGIFLSMHSLVVETPSRVILVDTCIGNDKNRGFPLGDGLHTQFIEEMKAAGYPREKVDCVICTHLHVDHVGWNTMLVDGHWVPTFPNARYLIGRVEFEYWRDQQKDNLHQLVFADSVQPVWDAGLVDLVETKHSVCDEVRLTPTIGHSPGHVSVEIQSQGQAAMITGDFVHHPFQFAHPDWNCAIDFDAECGISTRLSQFSRLAGGATLVIGTHFVTPTAGKVVRDGAAYRFET